MINSVETSKKQLRSDLDEYIGKRVKERRSALKISQERLGKCLGVTFQQIQKYEKGINRISTSMLYVVAKALHANILYFVDGYNGDKELSDSSFPIYETEGRKETTDLLRVYYKISDASLRKKIFELIKACSSSKKESN